MDILILLGLVAVVAWSIYSSVKGYKEAKSAPPETRESLQKKWKQGKLTGGLVVIALALFTMFGTDVPKGGGIIWYDIGAIGVGLVLIALSIFVFSDQSS
jgi:hypothetical protein